MRKITAGRGRTQAIADLASEWGRECPDLDLGDFLIELYLLRLGFILDKVHNQHSLAEFGLRAADMRVLFALRRSGPPYALRPTDLFRSLFVTSGAVTKQADRLIDRGYAERIEDKSFRGGFLIRLTRKGLALTERAIRRYAAEPHLKDAFARFSPAEKAAAKRFCLRIIEGLEADGFADGEELAAG